MTHKTLPLTGLPATGIAPSVIVCGDPARADQTAAFMSGATSISERREYRAHQGTFEDLPVLVCSHGVGAPGAAIAFEELIVAGARRIVRIGTCGALQPGIMPGHLIIATAAVQNTGYGRETVPAGYPAVADLDLTLALRQAAAQQEVARRSGLVVSRDNFYQGVAVAGSPDYAVLAQAQVLAVEMECAALFIVGTLRQVPTAAILAVDGNLVDQERESMEIYRPHQESVTTAVSAAIQIALKALRAHAHES
jgi:uridine phosphorylase